MFAVEWCGWVWESVIPQTLPSPLPTQLTSPTLPILNLLVVFFLFITNFPRPEGAPRGGVGYRCSRSALSWVAAVVLRLPKGRQQQTLARRVLTKVWHTSDAEQSLNSSCPHGMLRTPEPWCWLAVRVGDVLPWLAWGAHGASESQATELLKHQGSSRSSCPACNSIFIGAVDLLL